MKNTYLPLDIIFANSSKSIVSIAEGHPLSTSRIPSGAPASMIVEVPAGWCTRNGVKIGDWIEFNISHGNPYFGLETQRLQPLRMSRSASATAPSATDSVEDESDDTETNEDDEDNDASVISDEEADEEDV